MSSIHVKPLFGAATDRQKEVERQELAGHLAEFERTGGKVQTLGNTPIGKNSITRRQVVEGGADGRASKKRKSANG
ncbi:hypothetical protein [uncultured Stenotrophomonas sp.]|uniref:hypothetical protein n=1 Tax=uncultured Stenotrophomonas sp. TaxID=165438 RepID=UPI0028EF0ED5|nr:hypothetical protein [uncultured Stenotrophomonas sp.]